MGIEEKIKKLRLAQGYSQQELADLLNISHGTVGHWENGRREPSNQALMQLSHIFNVSIDYLLDKEELSEEELRSRMIVMNDLVKVYGRIPAGVPFEAIENVVDEIPIPKWLAKKKDLFGLLIVGESMNKILPNGVVGVFQKTSSIENGEIGAILVNGYDATVKRFYKLTDSYLLEPQSFSDEFKPQIIKEGEEEVRVIGKLLWYSPLGQVK